MSNPNILNPDSSENTERTEWEKMADEVLGESSIETEVKVTGTNRDEEMVGKVTNELEPILDDTSLTGSEKSRQADRERQKLYEEYEQREFSGLDYSNFAREDINRLYNNFNVDESDAESQTLLADEIEINITLDNVGPEVDLAIPQEIFGNIANSYLAAAEIAHETGHDFQAKSHERQADVVKKVKERFIWQMIERDGIIANRAQAEALENQPENPNSLPGDVIK